jgi:hypothetical protein
VAKVGLAAGNNASLLLLYQFNIVVVVFDSKKVLFAILLVVLDEFLEFLINEAVAPVYVVVKLCATLAVLSRVELVGFFLALLVPVLIELAIDGVRMAAAAELEVFVLAYVHSSVKSLFDGATLG